MKQLRDCWDQMISHEEFKQSASPSEYRPT